MSSQTDSDGTFRQRIAFTIFCGIGATASLFILWEVRIVLLLLFAGLLAALALSTAASWVESRLKLRRSLSLSCVIATAIACLGVGLWTRGNKIAEQVSQLQVDLPAAMQQIAQQLRSHLWGQWLLDHWLDRIHLWATVDYALPRMAPALAGTATLAVGLVLVVMISIYVAAEPDGYLQMLRLVVPHAYLPRFEACFDAVVHMLRYWLIAKFLSMLCIGAIVYLGLLFIGVPLAGTLGLIAALLTFIPNVGPFLSVVPAAALAFAVRPSMGVLTLALYATAHFLEGNIITPMLERRIVRMPPALTLVVQAVLAVLTGSLGVVMAAPLTAAALGIAQALRTERNSDKARAGVTGQRE